MAKFYSFFVFILLSSSVLFSQGSFTAVTNSAPFKSGGGLSLLPDGSVLCKAIAGKPDGFGNAWMKFRPDANGSYLNGTWSMVTPMVDSRLYFSSQVLKDGRLYIAGGEYGSGFDRAEIYNDDLSSWSSLPISVANIGDAGSDILDNGLILQACVAPPGTSKVMVYNPSTNSFTNGPNTLQSHNESSWIKLRDGSILMVDLGSTSSERYIPATNQWIADATVPVNLYDPYGFETGAALLLPDGRAFFLGSTGNTAFYTPSGSTANGTWTAGPQIPSGLGCPDAAAAMMPNGKILMATGPAPTSFNTVFVAPTTFFEFDYTNNTFTQKPAFFGNTLADTAFNVTMLDLPDGTVLAAEAFTKNFFIYKPSTTLLAVGKPTITAIASNTCARSYTASGLLFNGISEGAYYGDDWQMNTNFPIFRLESAGQVYYCKSKNWTHTNIQRFNLIDTAQFSVPGNVPAGIYSLVVVANGIASTPFNFTLSAAVDLVSALQVTPVCSGTSFSYVPQGSAAATSVLWTRPQANGISNPAVTTPQGMQIYESLTNTLATTALAIYNFTISNGTCTNTRVLSVPVIQPIQPIIKGNASICSGKSGTLSVRGFTSAAWSNSANTLTTTVSPTATTIYTVIGLDDYGCVSQGQFTVVVKTSPTLQVLANTTLCANESTTVHVLTNASNYYYNNVAGDSTYVISPASNQTLHVNVISANACSTQQSIVFNVSACTGINALQQLGITVYPNPIVDYLEIKNKSTQIFTYAVVNVLGKEVLNGEAFNTVSINMKNLSAGIYTLRVQSEGKNFAFKCVKE